MRYLSVCSGIEAATVAWHPLGWTPVGFAEIEKFPAAVLATHYPDVPNFGDMTKFKEWPDVRPDVLVGGTPCQSFSVAGLRKGMADPRGNLALTYLAIADQYCPEWLLWENVPGVLSSNGGRDFGAFLGGMVELGYGFAYRVLDAQYVRVDGFGRAVPQRRRRVFVVGNSRDWRCAAAVLFERESLSGNSAPRREAGSRIAAGALGGTSPGGGWRFGPDEAAAHQLVPEISHCLNAGGMGRQDYETETVVPVAFATAWAVRRLTPTECERLQGFPDGYTNVPWRGKNGAPDGPRYKALGNSMAANAMRWLGTRIQMVSEVSSVCSKEGLTP